MVTNDHAPPRHPHHRHLEWVTTPGPSHRQITGKDVITARSQPQAATARGGEENAHPHQVSPRGKQGARGGI